MENDGILTVNFAATQDGVILYPDLVKVSVSLSDGGIAGFEAEGYIMNHMTRSIPAAAISDGEAEKQVASGFPFSLKNGTHPHRRKERGFLSRIHLRKPERRSLHRICQRAVRDAGENPASDRG
jgi:hypothetical protein